MSQGGSHSSASVFADPDLPSKMLLSWLLGFLCGSQEVENCVWKAEPLGTTLQNGASLPEAEWEERRKGGCPHRDLECPKSNA